MIRYMLAAALMIAGSAVAAPQVLVDLDMTTPAQAVRDVDAAKGKSIVGALPTGISENSGWQENTDLAYVLDRDATRSLLRITVKQGSAQLQVPLPDVYQQDGFYRLKITARSEQRASMNVGLRDGGAPYTYHFSTDVPMTEIWQDAEYSFRIGKQSQPFSLFLIMRQTATAEIARIQLIKESREDLIAATRTQHPEGGEKRNRVNVSRFPLGMQSGWGLDRDLSDEQFTVASDDAMIGPSGSPALKLVSPAGKPMKISPPPFDLPWTFQKHTVSLAVRGQGTLSLRVFSDASMWDDTGVASKDVKLEDRWQRVAVTFDPVFMGALHQLRLTVNGTAWIDALQLLPGEEAGDYAPRLPYEVAFGWPKSQASLARIQFEDEPALLDFAVTGVGAGGEGDKPVLMSKLVNVYGQETKLPPIPLAGDFVKKGQIRLDGFGDRPLGAFRVEAWVEDGAGKRIGSANEAIILRLRRPRHWGEDAPRSAFGTHMNSSLRHIVLSKAIGMNWTRLHDAGTQYTGWSFLEASKGQWTFFDADIQRYRDGKINVLGLLSTTPGWASSVGRPATGYFDRWVRPLDNSAFGKYVETVVGRYKGTIDQWEIWNEPWGKFWSVWDKEKNDNVIPPDAAESYAALSKVAYASAKKANPQSTIGGINTYGGLATNWTKDLVKFGATADCDVYTYHQYNSEFTGFPGDAAEREYKNSLTPIIEANAGRIDKPVWFSEGNAHEGKLGRGMYVLSAPGKYQDDVMQLSDNLSRFSIRLLSLGVDRFFYYTMHHHGIFRSGASPYSACITDDGAAHPSAAAFSAMAWELEDTKFVKTIEVAGGVYAHLFQGDGRSVAAITSAAKWAPCALPNDATISIRDLFGNPLSPGSAFAGRVVYISRPGSAAELEQRLK